MPENSIIAEYHPFGKRAGNNGGRNNGKRHLKNINTYSGTVGALGDTVSICAVKRLSASRLKIHHQTADKGISRRER